MGIIKRKNLIFGQPKTVATTYGPRDVYTFGTSANLGITNRVGCWPVYVDKKIFNPNLCMEIAVSGSPGGIPVGIYNGSNGLDNAPLIWSGFLAYGGQTGVYKRSANISLEEGFYVLASCSNFTGTTGYAGARVAGGIRHVKNVFGDFTGLNSFNITLAAFEFTGISLPQSINGNNITGAFGAVAPVITIEY